jgi:hypothetical protein
MVQTNRNRRDRIIIIDDEGDDGCCGEFVDQPAAPKIPWPSTKFRSSRVIPESASSNNNNNNNNNNEVHGDGRV